MTYRLAMADEFEELALDAVDASAEVDDACAEFLKRNGGSLIHGRCPI